MMTFLIFRSNELPCRPWNLDWSIGFPDMALKWIISVVVSKSWPRRYEYWPSLQIARIHDSPNASTLQRRVSTMAFRIWFQSGELGHPPLSQALYLGIHSTVVQGNQYMQITGILEPVENIKEVRGGHKISERNLPRAIKKTLCIPKHVKPNGVDGFILAPIQCVSLWTYQLTSHKAKRSVNR